jgi:hypothetical protein
MTKPTVPVAGRSVISKREIEARADILAQRQKTGRRCSGPSASTVTPRLSLRTQPATPFRAAW